MEQQIGFETESLIVRRFVSEDYKELRLLTAQSEITDMLPDWAMTDDQLKGFLEFVIDSYDKFHPDDVRILLAVEHKTDRRVIGWCGVFPNDMLDPNDREVAYAISKDYRNHGYTTEAVEGMIKFMFNHTALLEIVAIVKPFNLPSRRVIEKAGFACIKRVTLSNHAEYDYMVVRRESWNRIHSIAHDEIEPYLELIAEIEHVKLDLSNPDHDRWLRKRIRSYYDRGAMLFACKDRLSEEKLGIVAVLHESPPEGIEALWARSEMLIIGVVRARRRSGIGTILLKHAEDFARSRGSYCLFMMTYAEDYDVISFYGKNGFVPVATLPDVYGPGLEGNVFMRKILR